MFAAGRTVSLTRIGLGLTDPVADRGLGRVEVLGDLTDRAIATPARPTTSASHSDVNERRARTLFLPTFSMMNIFLPGPKPLISDVRQSEASPVPTEPVRPSPDAC